MNTVAEIENLFKNLHHGIKIYGIKNLNDAINKVIHEKNDLSKEIDFVLDSVASEYGITKEILIHSNKRGDYQQARQLAYCLLYLDLGLTLREIAKDIFNKYHRVVAIAIEYHKKLDENHPMDKKFIESYKKQQEKLLNFINTNKHGVKDL
jgi:chromosomal replication initiation ATPase DnaA